MGFDSRRGQIGQNVTNNLPPLQRFFQAVLSWRWRGDEPLASRSGVTA